MTSVRGGTQERLWRHRFTQSGPHSERWYGIFVPLTGETGLDEIHCTWRGVFVAEAIAALRPRWHLLLSDTDVAPTALFEVAEMEQCVLPLPTVLPSVMVLPHEMVAICQYGGRGSVFMSLLRSLPVMVLSGRTGQPLCGCSGSSL